MRIRPLVTSLAVVGMLAGCAIGHEYDYRAARASVPVAADGAPVAVVVLDRRPYVLSGDKTADFIGLQRGGYGNPFDVTTVSGAPLGDDLAAMLVGSVESGGGRAVALPLAPTDGISDALARFDGSGAGRLLLIEMREWKTDVVLQMTVQWDLTARVYDRSGTLLAEDAIEGLEGTGSASGFEAPNETMARGELAKRIDELLSRPAIVSALG